MCKLYITSVLIVQSWRVTHDEGAGWDRGWGWTVSPVCSLYLKGQHYVLWLREARSDEEGMQKTKAMQHQRKSKATKHKQVMK